MKNKEKYFIHHLKNNNKKKIYINLLNLLAISSRLNIKDIINNLENTKEKKNDIYYFNKIIKTEKDENYDNSINHAQILYYLFEKYTFLHFKSLKKNELKILDYGCGHCTLGIHFSKLLGINTSYGCDIENWNENFKKEEKNSNFIFKKIIENKKIPFENKFFDIIIISMVLHHVKDYSFVFNELYRLLKPNGILILREHDAVHKTDKDLIDLQHYIYMYNIYGNQLYDKNKNYYSNYKSINEWKTILQNKSFKNIIHNYEFSNPKRPEIKLARQCIIMCHK